MSVSAKASKVFKTKSAKAKAEKGAKSVKSVKSKSSCSISQFCLLFWSRCLTLVFFHFNSDHAQGREREGNQEPQDGHHAH